MVGTWYLAITTMRTVTVSLFHFLLLIAAAIFTSFCDGNSSLLCIESEREALLKFKNDLIDPSNRLSSWVQGGDCCKWNGVFCNNSTGHVTQLHLAAPPDDHIESLAEWEAVERSKLGGTINPSLLQLKHLTSLDLSYNNFSTIQIPDFFGLLGSLTYLNLSLAQFQGAIPQNLGNLSKLQYLDMRYDSYPSWPTGTWNMEAKNLEWVSRLSSLKYLDLSAVDLHKAPDWQQVTFNLPSLLELHLSGCKLEGPIPDYLGNKSFLQAVDLSYNSLNSSIPSWLYSLNHLQSLDLSYNKLQGRLPTSLEHLCNLKEMDLSFNQLEGDISEVLQSLSGCSLHSLESLDVAYNKLSGHLIDQLGHFKSLVHLSLAQNKISGPIPLSIGELPSLKFFDVSENQINGTFPPSLGQLANLETLNIAQNKISGPIPLSIGELSSLKFFDISENRLNSTFPPSLGQLANLETLDIAQNNISGPIPLSIGKLSSLKFFDVSENQLNGIFPPSLGDLANLKTLNIRQNRLEGVVSETLFSNLTRLTTLKASGNMLRFQPNSSWFPPFQCEMMELSQWYLGPKFPQWLKSQRNLFRLNISHVGISDVVPTWFLNFSSQFDSVDLSSNDLTGEISYLNVRIILDLSSNRFTGPLPRVVPTLYVLILSNNSFSGSLVEFVCDSSEPRDMGIVDISTNRLFGEIPDCWNQWKGLFFLNLENNNLTGKIPSSLGNANFLQLNLRNNSMFGELPSTLQNCVSLVILDLSDNHFSGSVPAWIGEKLSSLEVLRLRSNNFDGHIPHKICALQSLQNLDLAHNNISGAIPKCFRNFTAMTTKNKNSNFLDNWSLININDRSFHLSSLLVLKGRQDEYGSILGLVTSLDLSANRLTGEIPKELGTLIGLGSLNLSWNLLTGNIPDNIGNLKSMESLDLSMNQLHGGIPSSFSNLNFLNHFNVSYNNLRGQIPTSTQLQSFQNSSYMPNHLCGPPVSKTCITKGVPTDGSSSEGSHGRSKVNGLYVSIVVGFVMGFWCVVAPLFFIRSWRHAYYQKLDHVGRKLYVFWATLGR